MGTQQSSKCNEINIKIGNENIPQTTKSKHLGMQVENTVIWNAHIDQLVKIVVYKCLNGMAPQYLNDKITCNDN